MLSTGKDGSIFASLASNNYFLSHNTIGDYAEPVLALWDARDFDLLTVARCSPAAAFHSIAWNPYVAGEFVTVGSNAAALQFWRIEEKGDQVEFNVRNQREILDKLYVYAFIGF